MRDMSQTRDYISDMNMEKEEEEVVLQMEMEGAGDVSPTSRTRNHPPSRVVYSEEDETKSQSDSSEMSEVEYELDGEEGVTEEKSDEVDHSVV